MYELFVTSLPADGFQTTDVLDLYHGRGAFEAALADEEVEGDPDRWCSIAALGQELWQIVWQWVWNLRLALGQVLAEDASRSLEWAPAVCSAQVELAVPTAEAEAEYGPLEWAQTWGRATGGFGADAFTLRDDGPSNVQLGSCCGIRRPVRRPLRRNGSSMWRQTRTALGVPYGRHA